MQEIVYTSAPQGLRPGSSGFCTVVSTDGMAKNLAERLESLSGYRHAFDLHGKDAPLNPVNYSHLILRVANRSVHVLSRVANAGQDYSGRSNKLAHHLALFPDECTPVGPAELLAHPDTVFTEWNGQVQLVPSRALPPLEEPPLHPCRHWKSLTGDAGWAGAVAQHLLNPACKHVSVIFRPGTETLPLLVEVFRLLPASQRWQTTFSTYFVKPLPGSECRLRFILDGTAEATTLRNDARATIVDTATKHLPAPNGPLVESARTGVWTESVQDELMATHSAETGDSPSDSFAAPPSATAAPTSSEAFGTYSLSRPFARPVPPPPPRARRFRRGATDSPRSFRAALTMTGLLLLLSAVLGAGYMLGRHNAGPDLPIALPSDLTDDTDEAGAVVQERTPNAQPTHASSAEDASQAQVHSSDSPKDEHKELHHAADGESLASERSASAPHERLGETADDLPVEESPAATAEPSDVFAHLRNEKTGRHVLPIPPIEQATPPQESILSLPPDSGLSISLMTPEIPRTTARFSIVQSDDGKDVHWDVNIEHETTTKIAEFRLAKKENRKELYFEWKEPSESWVSQFIPFLNWTVIRLVNDNTAVDCQLVERVSPPMSLGALADQQKTTIRQSIDTTLWEAIGGGKNQRLAGISLTAVCVGEIFADDSAQFEPIVRGADTGAIHRMPFLNSESNDVPEITVAINPPSPSGGRSLAVEIEANAHMKVFTDAKQFRDYISLGTLVDSKLALNVVEPTLQGREVKIIRALCEQNRTRIDDDLRRLPALTSQPTPPAKSDFSRDPQKNKREDLEKEQERVHEGSLILDTYPHLLSAFQIVRGQLASESIAYRVSYERKMSNGESFSVILLQTTNYPTSTQ